MNLNVLSITRNIPEFENAWWMCAVDPACGVASATREVEVDFVK